VQPLVSRQQPGHVLEPPPIHDEEAVATEPASAFRWVPTEGRASITWREATSNSVRDERRPENRSALKNGKEAAASPPTCIGIFRDHRYRRAIARGSGTGPSPSAPNGRHHTVLSRSTVPSPGGSNSNRREAPERVDHFIRRAQDYSSPELREPGDETDVNKPLNRPLYSTAARLTSAVHLQDSVQSTTRLSRAVPGVLSGATAC